MVVIIWSVGNFSLLFNYYFYRFSTAKLRTTCPSSRGRHWTCPRRFRTSRRRWKSWAGNWRRNKIPSERCLSWRPSSSHAGPKSPRSKRTWTTWGQSLRSSSSKSGTLMMGDYLLQMSSQKLSDICGISMKIFSRLWFFKKLPFWSIRLWIFFANLSFLIMECWNLPLFLTKSPSGFFALMIGAT